VPPGNPTRLLKLADREFRQLTEERTATPPAPRRFIFQEWRICQRQLDNATVKKLEIVIYWASLSWLLARPAQSPLGPRSA
jgi:hypothetical protein